MAIIFSMFLRELPTIKISKLTQIMRIPAISTENFLPKKIMLKLLYFLGLIFLLNLKKIQKLLEMKIKYFECFFEICTLLVGLMIKKILLGLKTICNVFIPTRIKIKNLNFGIIDCCILLIL